MPRYLKLLQQIFNLTLWISFYLWHMFICIWNTLLPLSVLVVFKRKCIKFCNLLQKAFNMPNIILFNIPLMSNFQFQFLFDFLSTVREMLKDEKNFPIFLKIILYFFSEFMVHFLHSEQRLYRYASCFEGYGHKKGCTGHNGS